MVTAVGQLAGTPSTTATASRPVGGATSARALRTLLAAGRKLDVRDPAVAKQVAAQFLSELFFAPLLAEARQFPLGRELATGGRTEAIFGQQLDQQLADGVAVTDRGLVKQMMHYFQKQARPVADGGAGATPDPVQNPRAGGQP